MTETNPMKCCPWGIAQEKILFNDVLIFLGQHCIGKSLCNVVLEAAENITQQKLCSMLS